MIFEEFNPKIHNYHKVAEFIYSVDFRTYDEVFKTKENAISSIEDLLLIGEEDSEDSEDNNDIDRSNSRLYVVLDDNDFEGLNSDNTKDNGINNIRDKYNNSIDISLDVDNETNIENSQYNSKNIIGILQIVKGKKESLFGDILFVMTKLKSFQALRFSYIYFLDSLVLANLNEDDLYIAEIAIDECKRGKGLGTQIIKKVIKKAKEKGYKRVVLDTDLRNTGAAKLYESIGFKKFDEKCAKLLKKDRGMCNMEYIL
ncbi:GNAT family N-acetyltransferase [Methanobrevibacter sp. TMH8]|uniref:GNAT family N-acetyltransferase n=1 Tax=Methanobrevibacter sp. TMH8 TaxID=2848611 RepID=UPI001CC9F2D1|nr:GNAT family N-acetyltransferase [Methanobrevibacter sp. TMH8]